jgi:hypothetical protein
MLARIDAMNADIAELDAKIEEMITPSAQAPARLDEVSGIGPVAAAILIAEIGTRLFSSCDPDRSHVRPHTGGLRSAGHPGDAPRSGRTMPVCETHMRWVGSDAGQILATNYWVDVVFPEP